MRYRPRLAFASVILLAGCAPVAPSLIPPGSQSSTPILASIEAGPSAPPPGPPSNGPIAFIRYVGGRPSIWQVEADGTNERLVVNDLLSGIEPAWYCVAGNAAITAWSPDGDWLAFAVGFGRACDAHVGLVSADGSVLRMIGDASSFAWAPGSRELVLTRHIDVGSSIRSELHFVDPEGRETRPAIGDETLGVTNPVYSPDGTRLAFAATQLLDGGEWLTHVLDLTSGDVAAARHGLPVAWSPDGSGVLVTRLERPPDEPWYDGLYLVELADGTEVFVDKAASGAWSLDGSHFAYFQHRKVVIADADLRQRVEVPYEGILSGRSLSWAPDGNWLAFSLEGSADVIYLCASDGSGVRKLAEGRAAAWQPLFP
jgi:Tol biopolymer transport system component